MGFKCPIVTLGKKSAIGYIDGEIARMDPIKVDPTLEVVQLLMNNSTFTRA